MTDVANPSGDETSVTGEGLGAGGSATEDGVTGGGTGGRDTGLVAATKMGDVDPEHVEYTPAGPGGPDAATGEDTAGFQP